MVGVLGFWGLDELFIKNQLKGHILSDSLLKERIEPRTNADILRDNKELTRMLG